MKRTDNGLTPEEKIELAGTRNPNGTLRKGNRLGALTKGVPKGIREIEKERKVLERELNQRAKEEAQVMLNDKLGDVLGGVYEQAMAGDVKAMALWLKHSTPVAPQAPKLVNSDLLAGMANESPEQIIQTVVRAMSLGEVDVSLGKEIILACKASIESNFTDRFRKLMKKASRDNLSFIDIMGDLQKIAEDIEPVMIEHEGDGHA